MYRCNHMDCKGIWYTEESFVRHNHPPSSDQPVIVLSEESFEHKRSLKNKSTEKQKSSPKKADKNRESRGARSQASSASLTEPLVPVSERPSPIKLKGNGDSDTFNPKPHTDSWIKHGRISRICPYCTGSYLTNAQSKRRVGCELCRASGMVLGVPKSKDWPK
eukprot:gb/GEZJ01002127.1/.p1 GENE.gb/GEZJ01002127.1/~~gb/GEZJ01002127.1/.p1  ORF type:complete len:163 (-),score=10.02 gb/GEZJ01002127.1/:579-1067(-)